MYANIYEVLCEYLHKHIHINAPVHLIKSKHWKDRL
jgi:hypothetical protein